MLKEFQDDDGHTRVDFAILNGDWLYEEQRQYKPEDWLTQVGFRNRRPVFRGIALKAWYDYLGWSNPVASLPDIRFGRAIFNARQPSAHRPGRRLQPTECKGDSNPPCALGNPRCWCHAGTE